MNKFFLLITVFFFLFLSKVSAQFEGTFGIGAHAKYGMDIASVGGGIHLHYYRTNHLRFAPSFTYYLPRKGNTVWEADADVHYIIPVSVSASLYPIVGINYSHRKFDAARAGGAHEKDWTRNPLGANLGLGVQNDIGYRLRANFEMKYQFIKDFSQVSFMAGIGFWF